MPADWLPTMARRPAAAFAIALCLASLVILTMDFVQVGAFGLDYRVFRYSTQVAVSDIYNPHPHAPFVYPPTAIAFFRPLGLMPISLGLAVWTAVSAGIFLFATRDVDRRAMLVVVISPVFMKCLFMGQSALILAAVILIATSQRGWRCGILLGLVMAIKPQMVALAPLLLLIRQDWKAVGGMAAAGLAMVVLALGLYGLQPWIDWWNAFPSFKRVLIDDKLLGLLINPAGVAQNFGLPALPFLAGGAILGLAVAVRRARQADGLELAALIVVCSVLSVPYALAHDVLALLPFAALLLWQDRFSLQTIAAILVLTMWWMALGLIIFAILWLWQPAERSAGAGDPHFG